MKRLIPAALCAALISAAGAAAADNSAASSPAAGGAASSLSAAAPSSPTAVGQSALSIQELVKTGIAGNLDLQKARRVLSDALDDLQWKTGLADTRLDLSGDYQESGELTGQAKLSVPVIPQLSLDASVTSTGSGSASLKVSPFAQGDAKYLLQNTYAKAALDLSYVEKKLAADIEAAACSALNARTGLTLARAELALQEEKTAVAESSYTMGRLSYTDLDSERSKLIAARQDGFDAERSLLSARMALYRLLGPTASEAEVGETGLAELEALIASRDAEIQRLSTTEPRTLALRQAIIGLETLREELSQTWAYRPDVSLAGGLSYEPSAPTPLAASASLSFSFSPSDIRTDDRAEIQQNVSDKEQEVSLERLASRFQTQILAQALSVARETLTTRRAELAQAEATAAQGEVLLSQGRWTSIELEQARLNVDSAGAGVFSAAAAVLFAQAQVLLLYGI